MTRGAGVFDTLKRVFSLITVEPITFFNFLAISYYSVPMQAGIYEVLCRQIFPRKDCASLEFDPVAQDVVQRATSVWSQVMAACYLAPALLADVCMGALGDIYGRQYNILIGISGMVLAWFPTMVVLAYPSLPLIILPIFNVVAGITGFLTIVTISCFAYLADVVPKKEDLTTRMVLLQMVNSIASVIGSISAAIFIRHHPLSSSILISLVLMTVAFFYTMFRIKQIPPETMRRIVLMKQQQKETCPGDGAAASDELELPNQPATVAKSQSYSIGVAQNQNGNEKNKGKSVKTLVKNVLSDVYSTYTKPRQGYNRLYIWIASLVYFLHTMIDMGLQQSVMGLFLMRRPFNWTPDEISIFRGASALINCVGNIVGIGIFKGLLKFQESTIIVIALVSSIADRIFTALSSQAWMIYASTLCGCLSTLLMPTMKSFTAQLVAPDEVGKVYTGFGLGSDLAHLLSALLLNFIYQLTVSTFPGCVFVFGAVLSTVGALLFIFVQVLQFRASRHCKANRDK